VTFFVWPAVLAIERDKINTKAALYGPVKWCQVRRMGLEKREMGVEIVTEGS